MENLESKTIFQTSNVNSIEITDFEITPEHFVLVGRMRTFLPASSTRLSLKFDELKDKQWGDSFWENNEDQLSALVLVVDRNGALVSDRVFSGGATRAIQNVVALDSSHFVAAGSTFSERGWTVSFSLQKGREYFRFSGLEPSFLVRLQYQLQSSLDDLIVSVMREGFMILTVTSVPLYGRVSLDKPK
jgi:hypothetical protein